jgi:hypothetical protein
VTSKFFVVVTRSELLPDAMTNAELAGFSPRRSSIVELKSISELEAVFELEAVVCGLASEDVISI